MASLLGLSMEVVINTAHERREAQARARAAGFRGKDIAWMEPEACRYTVCVVVPAARDGAGPQVFRAGGSSVRVAGERVGGLVAEFIAKGVGRG